MPIPATTANRRQGTADQSGTRARSEASEPLQRPLARASCQARKTRNGKPKNRGRAAEEGAAQQHRGPGEMAPEGQQQREQRAGHGDDVRGEPHPAAQRKIEGDRAEVEQQAHDDVLDPAPPRQAVGAQLLEEQEQQRQIERRGDRGDQNVAGMETPEDATKGNITSAGKGGRRCSSCHERPRYRCSARRGRGSSAPQESSAPDRDNAARPRPR